MSNGWWWFWGLMARVSIRVDRFEEGNMKRGRDTVVSRKLQLVSDLIYFLRILKGSTYLGAELPAGQPQLDVLHRGPDLLSWLVGRMWVTSSVGLELLCFHCLLETDVCTVPHPLATTNPVIHSWDRGETTETERSWNPRSH